MARFVSSTFGKISGKHGTAVAAVRKDGLCILKEYRIASNPNTPGQKNQRGKFGFVMKELNCLRRVFTQTYDGQYGINKAVALTMKTAVSGEFPDFKLDYSKLPISVGNLYCTSVVKAEKINAYTLKISWNTEFIVGGSATDKVNLVFLNKKSKYVIEKNECSVRANGSVEIELPGSWAGNEIHVWIYFRSLNGNRYSSSCYIGLIQL